MSRLTRRKARGSRPPRRAPPGQRGRAVEQDVKSSAVAQQSHSVEGHAPPRRSAPGGASPGRSHPLSSRSAKASASDAFDATNSASTSGRRTGPEHRPRAWCGGWRRIRKSAEPSARRGGRPRHRGRPEPGPSCSGGGGRRSRSAPRTGSGPPSGVVERREEASRLKRVVAGGAAGPTGPRPGAQHQDRRAVVAGRELHRARRYPPRRPADGAGSR